AANGDAGAKDERGPAILGFEPAKRGDVDASKRGAHLQPPGFERFPRSLSASGIAFAFEAGEAHLGQGSDAHLPGRHHGIAPWSLSSMMRSQSKPSSSRTSSVFCPSSGAQRVGL